MHFKLRGKIVSTQWINRRHLQLLLLLVSSLGNHQAVASLNVFTCEPEWAALAKVLGAGQLEIFSATTAMQDPHHIQARPSLIARARRADLLVCTGAELETGWLPLLLRKSGNAKIQPGQPGYFMAASYVSLLEKPEILDRSQGDIHAAGNPHIHLDPRRVATVAIALASILEKLDPAHHKDYQQALQQFSAQWQTDIQRWKKQASALRDKRIVVNHNSWVYLEDWLELQRVATLEPRPGIPPTSSYLSGVLLEMQASPADLIIYADYKDERPVKWLSEKTRIKNVALPFSVKNDQDLFQWYDTIINGLTGANP